MEVDVKNIRKDIEDLNKLIVDYENNILNTNSDLGLNFNSFSISEITCEQNPYLL